MQIAGLEIGYSSDLKLFGHKCDGQEFIGETFFVYAEDNSGNRWILSKQFAGVIVETGDEGQSYFLDNRPWARAMCESIVRRIKLRKKINLQFWVEGRPVYGSRAYVEYGQMEDVFLERKEG